MNSVPYRCWSPPECRHNHSPVSGLISGLICIRHQILPQVLRAGNRMEVGSGLGRHEQHAYRHHRQQAGQQDRPLPTPSPLLPRRQGECAEEDGGQPFPTRSSNCSGNTSRARATWKPGAAFRVLRSRSTTPWKRCPSSCASWDCRRCARPGRAGNATCPAP